MAIAIALMGLGPARAAVVDLDGNPVQRALAAALSGGQPLAVDGIPLKAAELRAFYARRDYRPMWIEPEGTTGRAHTLRRALEQANLEGLQPRDYHADRLGALWHDGMPDQRAKLDLLLSDGLMRYGADVGRGRLNPKRIDPEMFVFPRVVDEVALLRSAAAAPDLSRFLSTLPPQHAQYGHFRLVLAHLKKVAAQGGWPHVAGLRIEPGMRSDEVAALRRRLALSRDLAADKPMDAALFDAELEEAVKRFQARHGLEVDGIVGPKTLSALNTPVEERIRQVTLNMERWRWMPDDLGETYLLVNLAAFELELIAHGERKLASRVVVGRPYRRTPMFSSQITHVVFNPAWYVPRRIAALDLLPNIQKEPALLRERGFRIFSGWAAEARELEPESVDWMSITPESLKFRLRQDPGPKNALGRIKFDLPNPFAVYLHDTPARELFEKTERTFSAGCIRTERSLELARFLLGGKAEWNDDAIEAAIASGKTKRVEVPTPLKIHLVYMTAWIDEDARIHFRSDVYGRDRRLDAALSKMNP